MSGFGTPLASIPKGDILGAGRTTILHPLAVMNMSSHATTVRVSAGPNQRRKYALGLLMGSRSVQGIEIMTSLELFTSTDDELAANPSVIVDEKKGIARRKRFEQVFPEFDVLGWYILGDSTPSSAVFNHINNQVKRLFDLTKMASAAATSTATDTTAAAVSSEIVVAFLPMDPTNKTLRGPVVLVTPISDANEVVSIETVAFSIQSEESERIGAELATQVGEEGKASLSLQQDVSRITNSASLLRARVDVLKKYLTAVRDRRIEGNSTILQRIGTICARLPSNTGSIDTPLAAAMSQQETDALMVVFATVMNNVLNEANTLSDSASLAINGECLYGNPYLQRDKYIRRARVDLGRFSSM